MLGTRKWLAAAAAALIAFGAHAADAPYPARPVRSKSAPMPAAARTSSRACSREKFQASTGQPFVVENKPGASNTIAADFTAKAPARRLHAARRDEHRTGDRAAHAEAQLRSADPVAGGGPHRGRAERARRRRNDALPERPRTSSPPRRRSRAISSTHRRVSAARSTSRAKRSISLPASRRRTSRTRAAARRTSTCCRAKCR